MRVKFTCIKNIALYERSLVNVKVVRYNVQLLHRLDFQIYCLYFIHARKFYGNMIEALSDIGCA